MRVCRSRPTKANSPASKQTQLREECLVVDYRRESKSGTFKSRKASRLFCWGFLGRVIFYQIK